GVVACDVGRGPDRIDDLEVADRNRADDDLVLRGGRTRSVRKAGGNERRREQSDTLHKFSSLASGNRSFDPYAGVIAPLAAPAAIRPDGRAPAAARTAAPKRFPTRAAPRRRSRLRRS